MLKMKRTAGTRRARARLLGVFCFVILAASSATSNGVQADSRSVQAVLDGAVATAAKTVVLPQGRVEVEGKLRVRGAKDLVIEGAGTTLVFSDREGTTWSFDSCRNITLRGFTIDYDPLPFIQGRITGRSEDGKRFDFTVCDGYPGLRRRTASTTGRRTSSRRTSPAGSLGCPTSTLGKSRSSTTGTGGSSWVCARLSRADPGRRPHRADAAHG